LNPTEQTYSERADDIDLAAMWRVAWGSKYLISALALLTAAIAGFVALNITPIFRADIVVLPVRSGMGGMGNLSNQIGGLASLASVAGINLDSGGGADREAKAILDSRRLAEEFIKQKNLLEVLVPRSSKPSTMWLAVKAFRDNVITIREDKRTGETTVNINWKNPAIAAQWANGYVALANERIRARAIDEANRNLKFLNEQIEKTRVVEVQKSMFNLVENETKTLMLANVRAEYAFTVVDPAVAPERKISPHRSIYIVVGALFGAMLGFLIAYVRRQRSFAR
jgi:uncharacterized protein involved in exopolysaccharide biosynthesis